VHTNTGGLLKAEHAHSLRCRVKTEPGRGVLRTGIKGYRAAWQVPPASPSISVHTTVKILSTQHANLSSSSVLVII